MNAECPYQLCAACLALRDWASDPVVKAKGRLNAEYFRSEDPVQRAKAHRCAGHVTHGRRCIKAINPLLKLCRMCSEKSGFCQHCQKPLSAADGHQPSAVDEKRERLIDTFVVLFKTYGHGRAVELLTAHAEEIEGALEVIGIRTDALEARINERDPLRQLYGQRRLSDPESRCQNCSKPHHGYPAMSRALNCQHWTHGTEQAWCLFCALEVGFCAICGLSTDPDVPQGSGN